MLPDIKKIIILGGGSAGFLAAITLKRRIPVLDVSVIHSTKIPIIGVGEGSTVTMPQYLHGYLGIDPSHFHRNVHPTYKLGIKFLWGPRESFNYTFNAQLSARLPGLSKPNGFFCEQKFSGTELNSALMDRDKAFEKQKEGGPLIRTDVAYHLENRSFVEYLEAAARGIGVVIIDDRMTGLELDENGVKRLHLESGTAAEADLFVDCSGFRSELLGSALREPFVDFSSSLFCDRAFAGGWERGVEEPLKPYTTAETMDAGWAWQIEHDHVVNRGYVYSSGFISDDEAAGEFIRKNPKVKDPRLITFTSGAYERSWVKNVVAIGNASGFVEPLEATALAVICEHCAKLVQTLADSQFRLHPTGRKYYNQTTRRTWESIRRFLAMHYKFNTRIDTPFWKACREDTHLAGAEEIVDYYQTSGPSVMWADLAMGHGSPFGWEGYLVMLVGQRVPHREDFTPSNLETTAFEQFRKNLRERAENAFTMREALDMIRSDKWQWHPDFYLKEARRWGGP